MNKGLLFIIFVGGCFILIIYSNFSSSNFQQRRLNEQNNHKTYLENPKPLIQKALNTSQNNILIIYSKEDDALKDKLSLFLKSLLKFSSIPLHLHFFCDSPSENNIEEILKKHIKHRNDIKFTLYDLNDTILKLNDYIFNVMPLFSYSSGNNLCLL